MLAYTYSYVDSIDYRHVIGEVKNNTSQSRQFVEIIADFFDAQGHLVDNAFTYTSLSVLAPGQKTCFNLLLRNQPQIVSFQFEGVTSSTTTKSVPPLTVLNDSGHYDGSLDNYKLIGLVRNDAATQVQYVEPIATFYNASRQAIGCDSSYVNSTNLDPGQASSFTIYNLAPTASQVVNYVIQVYGQVPIEVDLPSQEQ
ncbi:MAG: FxLYD domain-containing protein [Anaerolineae bacterium]